MLTYSRWAKAALKNILFLFSSQHYWSAHFCSQSLRDKVRLMGWGRHVALLCWEVLMMGVPMRWPSLPELLLNVMLGFAVVGLLIWAAYEMFRLSKKSGNRRLEPSDIIAIGVVIVVVGALTITVGGAWSYFSGPNKEVSIDTVGSSVQAVTAQKFYSQRDKNDLVDIMTDLLRILDMHGDKLIKGSETIQKTWDAKIISITTHPEFDLSAFGKQIHDVTLTSGALHSEVSKTGEFRKKHKVYAEEIESVLSIPKGNNRDPFYFFQTSFNDVRQAVEAMHMARQFNNEQLLARVAESYRPTLYAMQNGDYQMRAWLYDARTRVENFRGSLK